MKVLPAMLLLCSLVFGEDFTTWQRVDHSDPARDVVTSQTIQLWGDHGEWWKDKAHLISSERGDWNAAAYSTKVLDTSWIQLWADNVENYWYDCMNLVDDYAPIHAQQGVILTIHDNGRRWLGAFEGDLETLFNQGWVPEDFNEFIRQMHWSPAEIGQFGHVHYSVLAILQRTADGRKHILSAMLLPEIAQGIRAAEALDYRGNVATAYWGPPGPFTYWTSAVPIEALADGHKGLIALVAPRHVCQGMHESAREFDFSQ